jgi:hypothetical protein
MTKKSLESQQIVEKTMHKFKRGKLKSGLSKTTVRRRKQAIAVGLSEARGKNKQ